MSELEDTLIIDKENMKKAESVPKCGSYPIRRDASLLKTFDSLIQNTRLSDIVFVVAGKNIAAHRFLLAARSSVFEAMFYGPLKSDTATITITDCSNDVFQTMLMYIYTNEAEIQKNNVIDVMIIAHKYDLSFLEAQCEGFISKCNDLEEIIQYFDVLFCVDSFLTLKKSLFKKIKEKFIGERNRNLFLHISNIQTLSHLFEEIATIKSNNLGQLYLDLFEMLIIWSKEHCDENDNAIDATNIRQSLNGLEDLLDLSKLNREQFAKCQEICPSFFSSSEMLKIYANLSPKVTTEVAPIPVAAVNKKCKYCLRSMTQMTYQCCGYEQ